MRLLTFKESAALCRCSEESLRKAVDEGHLLSETGCDGPDSDRIREGDLKAYRAKLTLADLARGTKAIR